MELRKVNMEEVMQPHKFKVEGGVAKPSHSEPYRRYNLGPNNPTIFFLEPTKEYPQGIFFYEDGSELSKEELTRWGLPDLEAIESEEAFEAATKNMRPKVI